MYVHAGTGCLAQQMLVILNVALCIQAASQQRRHQHIQAQNPAQPLPRSMLRSISNASPQPAAAASHNPVYIQQPQGTNVLHNKLLSVKHAENQPAKFTVTYRSARSSTAFYRHLPHRLPFSIARQTQR
jgi:hypothetical protein